MMVRGRRPPKLTWPVERCASFAGPIEAVPRRGGKFPPACWRRRRGPGPLGRRGGRRSTARIELLSNFGNRVWKWKGNRNYEMKHNLVRKAGTKYKVKMAWLRTVLSQSQGLSTFLASKKALNQVLKIKIILKRPKKFWSVNLYLLENIGPTQATVLEILNTVHTHWGLAMNSNKITSVYPHVKYKSKWSSKRRVLVFTCVLYNTIYWIMCKLTWLNISQNLSKISRLMVNASINGKWNWDSRLTRWAYFVARWELLLGLFRFCVGKLVGPSSRTQLEALEHLSLTWKKNDNVESVKIYIKGKNVLWKTEANRQVNPFQNMTLGQFWVPNCLKSSKTGHDRWQLQRGVTKIGFKSLPYHILFFIRRKLFFCNMFLLLL